MKKTYVTFHYEKGFYEVDKWAIEVKENEDLYEILNDVYSLCGVKYLRVNKSNSLKKGYKVIPYENGKYLKYI